MRSLLLGFGSPAAVTFRASVAVLLMLLPVLPNLSPAAEIALLAGATAADTDATSYGWELDFRHDFASPFALSASWINEGHLPEDHRDGFALQAWGRLPSWKNRASVSFGAGAYQYFDTKPLANGGHANEHGLSAVYSLSASYRTGTPWVLRLSFHHIQPREQTHTNLVLFGVGYNLGKQARGDDTGPAHSPGALSRKTAHTEVTPFLGVAVRNNLEDHLGIAGGLEYRRGISDHFDITLSLLLENDRQDIARTGLAGQIWAKDAFLDRQLVLGIGVGVYAFQDWISENEPRGELDAAGLVTLGAAYRVSDAWLCRVHWNRVMTDSDRDSDIFVLGVGYRWSG
jgi:hypothetical protein